MVSPPMARSFSESIQFGRRFDIAAVDLEEPRQVRALLATKAGERLPSISPDGRWIAYDSDDEGQTEVFVGPFPDD